MADIIREAPLGQALRWISGKRLFQYPEEHSNFELPLAYITQLNSEKAIHRQPSTVRTPTARSTSSSPSDSDVENLGVTRTKSRLDTMPYSQERFEVEQQLALERTKTTPIVPLKTSDGILLVDWYTTDDPANPQNWSRGKRTFVVALMCLYTWVVYTGSSIYAASELGVMQRFTVNPTEAVLPLSLYVLAYGIGPLVFAPLSEIPIVGRNPLYWATFILFFALSFPTAVVDNFAGLLVLRFLQGFFGSPALANAGATFQDMYSLLYVPYTLSWWVWAAWAGSRFVKVLA
jgi:DHA1 family multidrug resistance protein-like MFS transporter